MKKLAGFVMLMAAGILWGQEQDEQSVFKKRVLDNTEVSWLLSFYQQEGSHAAVTGGIGNEKLNDFAQNIKLHIPVKEDNVLNLDLTVSGYTSASSSNLNPFTATEDNQKKPAAARLYATSGKEVTGSPWVASSGASSKDMWVNLKAGYQHYSDDRNRIYGTTFGVANEFDYFSLGGGLDYSTLFNEKNTEISIGTQIYLDHWRPQYPIEIKTFLDYDGDLNAGIFEDVPILDQNGNEINKYGSPAWSPVSEDFVDDKRRNTYVLSLGFSQILTPNAQMGIFTDITYQTGWLSNPMQRVYFADKPNYYIGRAEDIDHYTDPSNTGVFQLADDYEKLPRERLKIPVGLRLHYYLNEHAVLRTYYRYYADTWGIQSHTWNVDLPLKISGKFTLYPGYRYYTQTAARYFAPYETHLSSEVFYTSDYDLSAFHAHQVGLGIKYTDIFTSHKIWKLAIKSMHLDFNQYWRSDGLRAHIISWHMDFVAD